MQGAGDAQEEVTHQARNALKCVDDGKTNGTAPLVVSKFGDFFPFNESGSFLPNYREKFRVSMFLLLFFILSLILVSSTIGWLR